MSGMLRTPQGNGAMVRSPTLLLLSSSEQSDQPTRGIRYGAQIILANCWSYHEQDIHFADVAQSHQSYCRDEADITMSVSGHKLCEGIREVERQQACLAVFIEHIVIAL
jgi:hypothetical protein